MTHAPPGTTATPIGDPKPACGRQWTTVEIENPLTCGDAASSTIHRPYYGNEMKYRVLRNTLGEENQ